MNVGGEPDRDDFGLPPVDIEVPDDARDLDRDVQAYRRELRAARRRRRLRRLYTPLTRDGLVLPLLAGCLVMVIISGVLLTVFSSGQSGADRPSAGATTHRPSAAASVSNPAFVNPSSPEASNSAHPPRVTDVGVVVAGRSVRLYTLLPAVLALTPAHCQCAAELRQLRKQAGAAGIRMFVIGNKSDIKAVAAQASAAGEAPGGIADDAANVLGKALRPSGLTAAFVRAGGGVTDLARDLLEGARLDSQFARLTAAGGPVGPSLAAPTVSP